MSSPAAPASLPTAPVPEPRGAAEPDGAPLAALVGWLRTELAAAQQTGRARPLLVGVVGLPGCGKSTLAASLIQALFDVPSIVVSLDDFYLPADERRARGLPLRGPPGTHDLALLDAFLDQLRGPVHTLLVPQFDRARELRRPPLQKLFAPTAPLALCLIEGWFVGAPAPGYEPLSAALDRLIYLDMAEDDARAARFAREAELRAAGQPVLSEAGVARLWAEALSPHFATWVRPLRERADAVLTLDAAHRALTFQASPGDPQRR